MSININLYVIYGCEIDKVSKSSDAIYNNIYHRCEYFECGDKLFIGVVLCEKDVITEENCHYKHYSLDTGCFDEFIEDCQSLLGETPQVYSMVITD